MITRLPRRYTKMRVFDLADDFDLLLYMDADMLAMGRIEAVLDYFAPNGIAKQPVGFVRDWINGRATFNAGFMAVQPSHEFFADVMAMGQNKSLEFDGTFGDQSFLNFWLNKRGLALEDALPQRWSWTELPPNCNLGTWEAGSEWFAQHYRNVLALHFAGQHSFMQNLLRVEGRKANVTTYDFVPERPLDRIWLDAWVGARSLLQLPAPNPSAAFSNDYLAPVQALDSR